MISVFITPNKLLGVRKSHAKTDKAILLVELTKPYGITVYII